MARQEDKAGVQIERIVNDKLNEFLQPLALSKYRAITAAIRAFMALSPDDREYLLKLQGDEIPARATVASEAEENQANL